MTLWQRPVRHLSLALFLFLSPKAHAEDSLSFKSFGKDVAKATIPELAAKVGDKEIKVLEPHMQKERTYVGFPLADVLTMQYGDAWKKVDEILFTCADGYQPSIPVAQILQKKAYLAHAVKGEAPFRVRNHEQANEDVALGPFYVVWDNINDKELLAEGGTFWPYQVVGMDLIDFSDKFPKLAPPRNSTASVKGGFLLFRRHCMSCHAVNGEGGQVSHVDLNSPVSVTEYFKEPWLEKWIANPAAMRPKTTMPPFPQDLPDRQAKIKKIILYLRAMKKNKV